MPVMGVGRAMSISNIPVYAPRTFVEKPCRLVRRAAVVRPARFDHREVLVGTIPVAVLFRVSSCHDMISIDPAAGGGARVDQGLLAAPDAVALGEPTAVYA